MDLYVMSGAFMTGKTTWIEQLLIEAGLPLRSSNPNLADAAVQEWARDLHLKIAGVCTPATFNEKEKDGIDAVSLPDCRRFALAARREDVVQPQSAGRAQGAGSPRLGWDFSSEAMERINSHLRSCADCDLLIVDELGPLELLKGEGYTEALRMLDAGSVKTALVVIRPALLDIARKRWGDFTLLGTDASRREFLQGIA